MADYFNQLGNPMNEVTEILFRTKLYSYRRNLVLVFGCWRVTHSLRFRYTEIIDFSDLIFRVVSDVAVSGCCINTSGHLHYVTPKVFTNAERYAFGRTYTPRIVSSCCAFLDL